MLNQPVLKWSRQGFVFLHMYAVNPNSNIWCLNYHDFSTYPRKKIALLGYLDDSIDLDPHPHHGLEKTKSEPFFVHSFPKWQNSKSAGWNWYFILLRSKVRKHLQSIYCAYAPDYENLILKILFQCLSFFDWEIRAFLFPLNRKCISIDQRYRIILFPWKSYF